MVKCPRCGSDVNELHPVPGDIMNKLQTMGETPPAEVCVSCTSDFRGQAAKASGGVLMAQERAKDQHRIQLWKSRVQLIKRARLMMNEKNYAEAAVSYEKYLKI